MCWGGSREDLHWITSQKCEDILIIKVGETVFFFSREKNAEECLNKRCLKLLKHFNGIDAKRMFFACGDKA